MLRSLPLLKVQHTLGSRCTKSPVLVQNIVHFDSSSILGSPFFTEFLGASNKSVPCAIHFRGLCHLFFVSAVGGFKTFHSSQYAFTMKRCFTSFKIVSFFSFLSFDSHDDAQPSVYRPRSARGVHTAGARRGPHTVFVADCAQTDLLEASNIRNSTRLSVVSL